MDKKTRQTLIMMTLGVLILTLSVIYIGDKIW